MPTEQAAPGAPSSYVILLVEDEIVILMDASDILREGGFGVLEATTAKDALQTLSTACVPDAMLTDINLGGGMDGLELIVAVKEQHPGLPVGIMSGQVASITEHKADAVLEKPYTPGSLVATATTLVKLAP